MRRPRFTSRRKRAVPASDKSDSEEVDRRPLRKKAKNDTTVNNDSANVGRAGEASDEIGE